MPKSQYVDPNKVFEPEFIRFKDIRFATSAVLALCHDVLITLMCYAILRISVGNAFIAVMLTILGYSINSTIVIFDRIRENLPYMKKVTGLRDLVNGAVNITLTRSIFTNLTTFASILMLYIIGVASIKEFTLPMIAGILAGACSSVFLTGPLWFFIQPIMTTVMFMVVFFCPVLRFTRGVCLLWFRIR